MLYFLILIISGIYVNAAEFSLSDLLCPMDYNTFANPSNHKYFWVCKSCYPTLRKCLNNYFFDDLNKLCAENFSFENFLISYNKYKNASGKCEIKKNITIFDIEMLNNVITSSEDVQFNLQLMRNFVEYIIETRIFGETLSNQSITLEDNFNEKGNDNLHKILTFLRDLNQQVNNKSLDSDNHVDTQNGHSDQDTFSEIEYNIVLLFYLGQKTSDLSGDIKFYNK